jgi:hypothetical protein
MIYSEIIAGSRFEKVDTNKVSFLVINPALRAENFTGAIVDALGDIDGQLNAAETGIGGLLNDMLESIHICVPTGLALFAFIVRMLSRYYRSN